MDPSLQKRPIMLPTGKNLVVSPSPHLSRPESVGRIMALVLLALLPPAAAGVWYFGVKALVVIVLSLVFSLLAEALWCLLVRKPVLATLRDGSAAVTGVLIALNLPPDVPFYLPLIGAFLAIWFGKQVFGGLGYNPFNPALVARVGLLIAFPALMTQWSAPRGMDETYPHAAIFCKSTPAPYVTCATPLGTAAVSGKVLGTGEKARHHFDKVDDPRLWMKYFLGMRGGCIGETCVPALLLGAVLLLVFNLINWRVTACFIGTVAVLTGVLNFFFPGVTPSPVFHILTGGLLLGAIYMATDMVTSPITGSGCLVFAVGCGVITTVIRVWGNYPEGVSFSILFMNALVPLIDRWCGVRPFGYISRPAEKAR